MNIYFRFFVALAYVFLAAGCSGGEDNPEPTPPADTPAEEKIEIRISPSVADSRANDYGFEAGDRIGLYVVNYSGNNPGTLSTSGNHVDNMRFSYDGSWTPDKPVTWVDNATPADFYAYYPYASVQSVSAYPFAVNTDQSAVAAYKASDLLTGKSLKVAPTESAIETSMNHAMSRAIIYLEAGNGFTKESLAAASVTVKLNRLKCESTVDLASGKVTPIGEPSAVTPLHTDDSYRALIVPQTVETGNLITIIVDGEEYNLQKAFTFESGKSYKFTVTLSNPSTGVNVNITPWIDDNTDNGGIAE